MACADNAVTKDCVKSTLINASAVADEDEFTVAGFNPANHTSNQWVVANVSTSTRNQSTLLMHFPGESKPRSIDIQAFKSHLRAGEITQISAHEVAMPQGYAKKMKALNAAQTRPQLQATLVVAIH